MIDKVWNASIAVAAFLGLKDIPGDFKNGDRRDAVSRQPVKKQPLFPGIGQAGLSQAHDPLVRMCDQKAVIEMAERRERERCQAIIMSPEAEHCREFAMYVAFKTLLSRGEALEALRGVPLPKKYGYGRANTGSNVLHIAGWDKAFKSPAK